MTRLLQEVWEYRSLWKAILYQQALARYQGTALGFFWTLLYPLLTFLTFSLIFSVLNNQSFGTYGVYFLSGYVPWMFLSNTASLSCDAFLSNSVYVTRVRVPRLLLPMAVVALQLVDLAAGLTLLLLMMAIADAPFSAALAILPVSLGILVVVGAGIAVFCATVSVFFRDFRHLLNSLLFLLFFFIPVLWNPDASPALRQLADLNPLAHLISLFQQPIAYQRLPTINQYGYLFIAGVLIDVLSLRFFKRREREFYFYV